jgi:hypothetical protein
LIQSGASARNHQASHAASSSPKILKEVRGEVITSIGFEARYWAATV